MEYTEKINRVIDYITLHLNNPLPAGNCPALSIFLLLKSLIGWDTVRSLYFAGNLKFISVLQPLNIVAKIESKNRQSLCTQEEYRVVNQLK